MPAHAAQHRIATGGYDEPAAETLRRPAAERETEVMHDALEPGGAPGIGDGEIRTQPFAKTLVGQLLAAQRKRRTPTLMMACLPATGKSARVRV